MASCQIELISKNTFSSCLFFFDINLIQSNKITLLRLHESQP